MAITTTIPIQGTFDIAKGRNSLRAHIAAQHWSLTFGARAAAALTALGELILSVNQQNLVIVRINVIQQEDAGGIEFLCQFRVADEDRSRYQEIVQRLLRATDKLEVREVAQMIQIVAAVWLNEVEVNR